MANPSVISCPLSGCGESHPVRAARNKRQTPYISCGSWQSTVFFKTPTGIEWLRKHEEDDLEDDVDDLEDDL